MNSADPSERLKTLLSILIALTAVTAALVAWQASRVGLKATSADGKALTAAMDEASTGMVIAATAFTNRVGVRDFALHRENARILKKEYNVHPGTPSTWLEEWQSEMIRAKASYSLLAPDYLISRDGHPAFDEERFRARARAEAAAVKAVDPAPFLAASSSHRLNARRLVELNVLFSLALFLFTVALKSEVRRKPVWTAAGIVLYLVATGISAVRILF